MTPPKNTAPKPPSVLILKRPSDNTTVQIVCPDCKRTDFARLITVKQHYTVVHLKDFESDDDAIEKCGIPVEEGGKSIGGEQKSVGPKGKENVKGGPGQGEGEKKAKGKEVIFELGGIWEDSEEEGE